MASLGSFSKLCSAPVPPSRIVTLDTEGAALLCDGTVPHDPWGISQPWVHNFPLSGLDDGYAGGPGTPPIMIYGPGDDECLLEMGAFVQVGQRIKADSIGRGVPVSNPGDPTIAIVHKVNGTVGETIPVKPMRYDLNSAVPTPPPVGTDVVNLAVVSSLNPSVDGTVTITVAAAPSVFNTVLPTGRVTYAVDGILQADVETLADGMASFVNSALTANTAQAYSQTLSFTGGQAPYTFATTSGTLPTGLTLSSSGVLSGTPTVVGLYAFTVTVTDALGYHFAQSFNVATVAAGHDIQAQYLGDSTYATATSPALSQTVTSSFTAPWQPPGQNITTAFGSNNCTGDGSTNDAPNLQAIIESVPAGTLLYAPAKSGYNLAGGTGVNEVQGFAFLSSPGATFTLTFTDTAGSPIVATITYSAVLATLVTNTLAGINAALVTAGESSGLIGVASGTLPTGGQGVLLTWSGTGFVGLPQPIVTSNATLGSVMLIYHMCGGGTVNFSLAGSGLSGSFANAKSINLIGDVDSSGNPATIFKSTTHNLAMCSLFNGGLVSGSGTTQCFTVQNIQFLASTTGGIGLIGNVNGGAVVQNCYFSGFWGLQLYAYGIVRKCVFNGPGASATGSIGCLVGGELIDGCDFNNWYHGTRAFGTPAPSVIRSTFELNHVGYMGGMDDSAYNNAAIRTSINDCTFTDNDYDIYLNACSAYSIANVTLTGGAGAPSGQSIAGLNCVAVDHSSFQNVQFSGTYSTAGINNTSGCNHSTFYGCGTVTGAGGTSVVISNTIPTGATIGVVDDTTALTAVLANWIVIDVTDNSVANLVGDNTTDNAVNWNALVAACLTARISPLFYLPGTGFGNGSSTGGGVYNISTTIDFTSLLAAGLSVAIVGDGFSSGGDLSGSSVVLTGSGSSGHLLPAFKFGASGSWFVRGVNIVPSGSDCLDIYSVNPILSSVQGCQAQSGIWLETPFGCCLSQVHSTGTATAFIVNNCLSCTIEVANCQGGGAAVGIQACGTALHVYASRFESNHIGYNLGYDPTGSAKLLTNSSFCGIDGEANDYFMILGTVSNCIFAGVGAQGSVGAPSGASIDGVTLNTASGCVFSGINIGGTYSDYAILVNAAASNDLFDGAQGNSGGSSSWSISGSAVNIQQVAWS